jgi:two-component system nitrate/nitrite response regulator NarL
VTPLHGQLRGKELSEPELDVLRAAAKGLSAEETAARLVKSPHTIVAQRRALAAKLGARNVAHAVALAYERGIL